MAKCIEGSVQCKGLWAAGAQTYSSCKSAQLQVQDYVQQCFVFCGSPSTHTHTHLKSLKMWKVRLLLSDCQDEQL